MNISEMINNPAVSDPTKLPLWIWILGISAVVAVIALVIILRSRKSDGE